MSNSIDQRIVEMKFDNAQFEKGVEETIKSLESLDKSLDLKNVDNIKSDLSSLASASTGVDAVATNISSGRSKIEAAFSELASGFGKVTLVTAAATTAVTAITSAFNFSGGWNRALNIENAKFQLNGLKIAWEDVCEDIDYAVLDTAYGMDSAAKAAAQLSASQVALGDDMKAALRGISGVAAMTNSSYDEIAQVFTRVAGNGRVMAVDLNSLASRGLNAAAELANAFGTTESEIREMVSRGEIDFQSFANAMDNAFGEHAKDANKTFSGALSNMNAAWSRFWANFIGGTDIDSEGNVSATGGGILNMLRRVFLSIKTVVSDLAKIFAPISEYLQPVTDAVGTLAENISNAIHSLWYESTGEDDGSITLAKEAVVIFKNIGDAATTYIRPIKAFFEALLPSFEELFNWAVSIRDVNFTDRLKLSEGAVRILESAFSSLGSIIKSVVGPIITGVTWVLDKLTVAFIIVKDALDTFFDAVWDFAERGANAFSEALGDIKNPLDSLAEAFSNSELMSSELGQHLQETGKLFGELWDIINGAASDSYRMPWDKIGAKISEITDHLFGFLNITGRTELSENLKNNFYTPFVNTMQGIWNLITGSGGAELVFSGLGSVFSSIANGLAEFAGIIGSVLADIASVMLEGLSYVVEIISGIGSGVIDFFTTVISNVGVLGTSFVDGLVEGLGGDRVEAAESSLENTLRKGFEAVDQFSDNLSNSHIGTLVSEIGDAFSEFGAAAKDHAPTIQDWKNLFDGVSSSVSKFMEWLDPIGRMQAAIEGLKQAFEGFGTDAFIGWGTKFIGDGSGIANLLDTLSTSLSNFWKTIIDNLPTGDEVAAAIGSLADGVVNVINTLAPLFEGLGRIIGTVGADAIEFFSGLFDNVANFVGLDLSGTGDFFKDLFESFNEFTKDFASGDVNIFEALSTGIQTLIDLFGNLINSILPGFQSALSDTGSAIDQSGLSSVASDLADTVSFFTGISEDSQKLGGELEAGGTGVSKGGGILVNALNWVSENLGIVVGVLAGGALLVTIIKAIDTFQKMEKSISGLAKSAKTFIDGVNNKLGFTSSTQTKIQQLRELIMSIVYLVAAVAIVSFIPAEQLWPAVGVVAALAVIVIAIVAAMELIDKKIGSGTSVDHIGMAAEIGSIAVAMLAISASLLLISLIPPDRALVAAAIIAGMMVGIKLIIKAISTSKISNVGTQLFAASAGIMLLGVALLEFTSIIAIFTLIPWGLLVPGIIAVVTELAVLTAVGVILGKNAGNMTRAAASIMAMGIALGILTASVIAMEVFRRTGVTDYVQDAIVLIGLLAALIAAVLVLNNARASAGTLQSLAVTMQTMGVVFLEISAALAIVETFANDSGEMLAAMTSLTVVLAAMVAALLVLEKFSTVQQNALILYEIAGALIVLSAAMLLISSAISDILSTESTWQQMLSAAVAMSLAFTTMAAALAILSSLESFNVVGLLATSAALLVVSAAMWVLADGLNSMQKVSWDSVWQLVALLTAITIAGAVAGMSILIAAGIVAIGAAILMIGTAVLSAGTGIEMFAVGLSILSQTMVPFVEELDEAMGKFAETMSSRFPELLDVFITNIQEFAARIPELISSIASVVTSVVVGIAQGLANSVPQVADALLDMMESAINWMSQNGDRLQDDIIGFAQVLGTLLGDAILGIISLVTSALGTILDGIGGMIVAATESWGSEAARQRANSYVEAYADEIATMGPQKVAEALKSMETADIQSMAEISVKYNVDEKPLQQTIAYLETILQDTQTMNSLTADEKQHIIDLADATANGAVISMADLYRESAKVSEELENLEVTQDGFVKDSKGIELPYQLLADNIQPIIDQYLPDMGVSVDDIISGMETLGNGGLLEGLGASMTDISSLFDVLYEKGIINEEQLASLNEIDLSSLEGSLGGVFDGLGEVKFQTEEVGKTAEISGEAFATALASGIDVSGMVASLGEAKAALDETYTEFNKVHVGGSAAINALAAIVSVQAARIKSDFNGIGNSARSLGSSISSALSGSGASSSAYTVGMNISIGLANGISAYQWIATQAAYSLGASAASSVKRGAQESSPSKITIEAGKFMAMGLGIGISQNERFALESAEELGYSTAKAMRVSLGEVSNLLDGIDWDANPVIRPVLDTSGIESGMMLINSMFGVSPAMQAAYASPGSGRIFTGGSAKIYHISVDLNYQAGDDAVALANGLVSKLEDYANLEG